MPRYVSAQSAIPTENLAPVNVVSASTFGAILGVHETKSGGILINDAGRRQLLLLDPQLRIASIVLDSAPGTPRYYGSRPSSFIPYRGDTILFVDAAGQSLSVIDGRGNATSVISVPRASDIGALSASPAFSDPLGRLVYRGVQVTKTTGRPAVASTIAEASDSAPIVRADLESRSIDTVARVKLATPFRVRLDATPDGTGKLVLAVAPVQMIDEYAVLPNGTIAIARGHDYHFEFINPNGSRTVGPKLPFDWRRISSEEKQQLADSARRAAEQSLQTRRGASSTSAGSFGGAADPAASGNAGDGPRVIMTNPRAGGASTIVQTGAAQGAGQLVPVVELPPLRDIPDYYPVLRTGALRADLDGNLWVLTATTAQSVNGSLVYDVVNTRGVLERRVRVPVGRSIVGFGRNAVYLMSGDRASGFHLERAPLR